MQKADDYFRYGFPIEVSAPWLSRSFWQIIAPGVTNLREMIPASYRSRSRTAEEYQPPEFHSPLLKSPTYGGIDIATFQELRGKLATKEPHPLILVPKFMPRWGGKHQSYVLT